MPDIEIYNNDKEALFQGVRLIIFSGLSLVLNKEKDCDFKRHLSWVGYTPLRKSNDDPAYDLSIVVASVYEPTGGIGTAAPVYSTRQHC